MALTFVGVDPDTKNGGSPTIWLDEEAQEFVFQGWKPGTKLKEQITATPAPDHEPGIPEGEDAIRMPFRMTEALRKACDAADRLG